MKALRIVQVVLVVTLAFYLLLFHNANEAFGTRVRIPWLPLPPLPAVFVVLVALLAGWLVGWLPSRTALWRRSRELRKLEKRIGELEGGQPLNLGATQHEAPVIPDRELPRQSDSDAGGRS